MKFKQLILCSGLCVYSSGGVAAQSLVIEDFESGKVSFTEAVNPLGANTFEVVDNPEPDAVNNSSKCWKYIRLAEDFQWNGFWCELKEVVNTTDYKYLHIKYYRTGPHGNMRVNMENNTFKKELLPMIAPQKSGEWENLVYDLQEHAVVGQSIDKFGLQHDFSDVMVKSTVVYIDEIKLSTSISGGDSFVDYQPKDLKISDVQETALKLTWSPLKNAVSYDIYKDDVLIGNASATSFDVTGLNEFDVYKFHLVGKDAHGMQSQPSRAVYVQTRESKVHKDARMAWWREARFGMFIHWGGYAAYEGHYEGENVKGESIVYDSAGSGNGGYAEWIMFGAQIPRDTYRAKVAKYFTASSYRPEEWVRMAKAAGMKYIIITSKHHEGLAMFNTNVGWNVMADAAAHKDLMRGLVDAARKEGMKIGFYYSQAPDWMNPGGMDWMPQNNNGNGGEWPYEDQKKYVNELVIPHLNTIVNDYGLDVIWFDMGQSKYPDLQYATLKALKQNPNTSHIIYNDRLSFNIDNGLSGDFGTPEQSIPDVSVTGRADGRDWETCMTMNVNWGYCAKDNNWKSTDDLIFKLIDIASKGGNFLLNIGPKPDGTFPQESIDRLKEIGTWMNVNGEAIYGTVANPFPKTFDWGKTTRKIDSEGNTTLYLHVYAWPSDGELFVPLLDSMPTSISILGVEGIAPVAERKENGVLIKSLPKDARDAFSTTIKLTFSGSIQINELYVYPDENGTLTFLPDDATVDGSICVEQQHASGKKNFGCWSSTAEGLVDSKIQWRFYVSERGSYNVSVLLEAVGAGQFHIAIDDTEPVTLNYQNKPEFHTEALGTLDLTEGKHLLTLTRSSLQGEWNYVNLYELTFALQLASELEKVAVERSPVKVSTGQGLVCLSDLKAGDCIRVYDTLGHCLLSKTAATTVEQLPLNSQGVLFVRIMSGVGNVQVARVIL